MNHEFNNREKRKTHEKAKGNHLKQTISLILFTMANITELKAVEIIALNTRRSY